MKRFQHLLTVIAVLTALVCCLSVTAFASDGGECGDHATWFLDDAGTITISGSGDISSAPWNNAYRDVIQKVVIEEGITSVCVEAFFQYGALKDVTLPHTLTTLGARAFSDCNLNTINLPTSLVNIDNSALAFDVQNLYIEDMAHFLTIHPDTNFPQARFKNLYLNNTLVTNLVIPDGIKHIPQNAFRGCPSIISVSMSNSVTTIGTGAFYNCGNLRSVTLSDQLLTIGPDAFSGGNSIKEITFPATLRAIGKSAFAGSYSSKLKTVRFLGNAPMFAESAFLDNRYLKAYYPANDPSWTESVLQDYGGIISWTPDGSIPVAEGQPLIIDRGNCGDTVTWTLDRYGVLTISGTGEIRSAPWVEKHNALVRKAIIEEGITSICYGSFANCKQLTEVTLPRSLTTMEGSNFDFNPIQSLHIYPTLVNLGRHAFYCYVENLYIEDWNHFIQIHDDRDSLFLRFKNLYLNGELFTDVEFPEGTWMIPQAIFDCCTSITSVKLPASVTYIDSEAFDCCGNLKTIIFSGDAPTIESNSFSQVTATAYYPVDNPTWTDEVKQNYDGNITWKAYTGDASELIINPFTDVADDAWYAAPVLWAKANNVTGGKTATTFAPEDACTRSQVVTFLWAANGKPEPKSLDNPFEDVPNDAWYLKPVLWAVEQGITTGTSETTFAPEQTCTRAQIATFLYAAAKKPAVSGKSPFTDVADTDWFAKPVIWAKEAGVTGGINETEFGPNNVCTRAQVVTFLYKVYAK